MCVQEVIGKSVKQAVLLPLYTAPDGYGLFYIYSVLFTYIRQIVIKSCFLPPNLFSSENTPRLFELPSLYVKYWFWSWWQWMGMKNNLDFSDTSLFFFFPGGTIRKQKCTMFCSACQRFHPVNFTFYTKEQTLTGTSVWLQVEGTTSANISIHVLFLVFPQMCFKQGCVHRPQSASRHCRW